MKQLTIVSIIFYLIAIPVMAHEQGVFGGFGGPVLKVTQFHDDVGVMIGGRGGFIINHTLAIGAGGYAQSNNIDAPVADLLLDVGYGGGMVELIILSDRPIHLSVKTLIGVGGVNYQDKDQKDSPWGWHDQSDGFFVAEPGVDLMLNVTKSFRVGMGVSYRYIDGIDSSGLSDSDMSGPSANFTLKFGKF
jgi:hypothetical protein